MSKLAFVGRFLIVFALVIVVGRASHAPAGYAAMLRGAANVVGPVTNGWWLETRAAKTGKTELWFRRGEHDVRLILSLEALALGLLPLLSLIGATPGLGWRRLVVALVVGFAGLFALDLLVLLLYPLLVLHPNALTDITGTFLGLLTFVGGPVILWFALTFDRLKAVWRLGPAAIAARRKVPSP